MHLIQILLPLYDNARQPFPPDEYLHVRNELTERFGGLTVYTRAPAEGLWRQNDKLTSRDDIVIFEVMATEVDAPWWREYRHELERRFRQDVIFIRAQQTRLL
ncbi:MAG TPA: hypothetical protein VGQ82_07575 [Chthoniobacterales bacterium]|nr:hypothetical protein [Chthoniobacterales bacterium]